MAIQKSLQLVPNLPWCGDQKSQRARQLISSIPMQRLRTLRLPPEQCDSPPELHSSNPSLSSHPPPSPPEENPSSTAKSPPSTPAPPPTGEVAMANFPVNPRPYLVAGPHVEHGWNRRAQGRVALGGEPPRDHEDYAIVSIDPMPKDDNELRPTLANIYNYLQNT